MKKEYYPNGKISAEYHIENNIMVGEYKGYFPDGKTQVIGEYSNGRMNGIWKYYYSNGMIQSIQKFNNNKLVSINFWDKNGGKLVDEGNGVAILVSSSNQIESKMSYKNNVLHGKCETWFPNGLKATEFFYEEGKPVGSWKYWDENGKLVKTENF